MGKIKLCAAALTALLFLLTSCGVDMDRAEYRERAFTCIVSFDTEGGRVSAKAVSDGKDITEVVLLSPDALCGMRIFMDGGGRRVELGDMILETEAFDNIIEKCELLLPDGDMEYVSDTRLGDVDALFFTVESGEGEKYEIYLDKGTYAPIEIRRGGDRIYITDLEFCG